MFFALDNQVEPQTNSELRTILAKLLADPVLCHEVLFSARHSNATPEFHHELIRAIWSEEEWIIFRAFRGAAKSTRIEEAMAAMACFQKFNYALIVGNSHPRACERIASIKHELDNNPMLLELFGEQHGNTWNEDELVLKNGVRFKALGARQSFRGSKSVIERPNFLFIDDLEDEENTATEPQREKLMRWVTRSLIQACIPGCPKRVAGTPLHPKAWLETLARAHPNSVRTYPIVEPAVTEPELWERSLWPSRYPLDRVRQIRSDMAGVGELQGFVQEYLCRSEDAALKPFQPRHIVHAQPIAAFVPSIVICDPARKGNATKAARTGYLVFSRMGRKFHIRQAYGAYHMPSEIVDTLFKLDDAFTPTWVVVEKDGLEEFLLQPLRQAMVARGTVLPLLPIMAPRDRSKDQFILGLQPFFEAAEIVMCDQFPDLETEITNFPTGLKDVLNALAYIVRVGAGKPVYEDFGMSHIAPDGLRPHKQQPLHLVINCEPNHTAAALVQYVNRCFRVYSDWVFEGGVEEALDQLLPAAVQAAEGHTMLKFFAPGQQFDQFNNLGLGRAAQRRKIQIVHGPKSEGCVGALSTPLRSQALHQPAFLANRSARWTINGMSQGYARGLDRSGILSDFPDQGYYATLMQGVESFARWLLGQTQETTTNPINWQVTPDGRQFMSARGSGADNGRTELKRR
jgi:hypothetical protein